MTTATPARPGRPDQPRRPETDPSPWRGLARKLGRLIDTPQTDYKVLLGITLVLTAVGLTMVLSSSMVTSLEGGAGVWQEFIKQGRLVVVGLVGMWAAMRVRPSFFRRLGPWLMVLSFVLLVAVLIPGVGVGGEEVGTNAWIRIGPVGIQPSEIAKIGLAVWGSNEVTRRVRATPNARSFGPFTLAAGAVFALCVIQGDLGMMMAISVVVIAIYYFGGVDRRLLGVVVGGIAVLGAAVIGLASYRGKRIETWRETLTLNFHEGTTQGAAYQSRQGILSLSDGSMFGQGLGQSRAKWFYLPEAKNDFIFAVLGEELGWLGALLVVLLFAGLTWFGIRVALAQSDPYLRMLAATVTVGITVQAFYNMSYVLGLVPMTGIQLPLISAGGTSAVITLSSLGILLNCARHEPATISSMQHEGRPLIDRLFLLPEPRPAEPGRERRERTRARPAQYGEPVTRRRTTQPPAAGRATPPRRTPPRTPPRPSTRRPGRP
ncbi:putative peptidoglycan glycosyltransferase FtsW [Corynebacterium bovis]|uniref:FtsW/RodA/SpoVE family cell cycle protein n=1 Tax=Corynebacterium bovis TaxID=36808 RepID=UPI0024482285|nr:putative peptidoglycan glycosyltransferase FtsW [Corynebacterium bovis]MDH2455947.1 putative peptidoglycan glycosyltransferase FtsW [Corynebacterium bovis]